MDNQKFYTLKNDFIEVKITDLGAELTSIINLKNNTEIIWQGKEGYWSRHNPILFPNVGRTFNDTVKINDKNYKTQQHGFARSQTFNVKENNGKYTFNLVSSKELKEVYPFDFILNIHYELKDSSLIVTWEVENPSDETILFTIGAHPAFNTLPKKSDYFLKFPGKTELTYKLLDPESHTAASKTYSLELKDEKYHLSDELFDNDALIFDDYQISNCIIVNDQDEEIVELISPDFPNYGIWSSSDAPYVCLEPWMGRTDDVGFSDDLSKKENVIALTKGEVFTKSYEIKVL